MQEQSASSSNVIKLALYWTIVGAPSIWAVWKVVVNSLSLFK
jgi:hypothetical protein